MRLHASVLPEPLLRRLRPAARVFTEHGFVLGEGTAVALWFGHRRSQDLDFFRETPIPHPEGLARELHRRIGLSIGEVARETIHGSLTGVPISFFEYLYPTLSRPVWWKRFGLWVFSPDDLAAMKLAAVVQRGEKKDFIDIYALGRRYRPLVELIRLYQRKFDIGDPGPVLRALVYFEDAETTPMPDMRWKVTWDQVRDTLMTWVRDAERVL